MTVRLDQSTIRGEICQIDSSDSVTCRKISIMQQVMTHLQDVAQMHRNSQLLNQNRSKKRYLSGHSLTLQLIPLYKASAVIAKMNISQISWLINATMTARRLSAPHQIAMVLIAVVENSQTLDKTSRHRNGYPNGRYWPAKCTKCQNCSLDR